MPITKVFSNGVKAHAIQTGTVAVKKEHFQYSGWGIFRIPKILFGKGFMPDMPIWVWAIETPTGNYLVDTGESTSFYNKDHFNGNKGDDYVNRKILEIKIKEEEEINHQLQLVGLSPEKIDAVLMTHMHLDHVDGIKHFSKQEFLISSIDWKKPYGVPLSTFPTWFKGQEITYSATDLPFGGSYKITDNIQIVSTPGHTLGHQSVLLQVDGYHILFAGDTTFTEQQLLEGKFGGIHMDLKNTRKTIKNIQQFSKETKLIYLPSHDPNSGLRLANLQTTQYS